ncbi:hypothetical protein GCM10027589_43190 [Actinocorallia lasiicapitis]
MADEGAGGGRQGDPAAGPLQQGRARFPFERGELLGDGRRGLGEGFGDGCDGAPVGEFAEQPQLAHIEHQLSLRSCEET